MGECASEEQLYEQDIQPRMLVEEAAAISEQDSVPSSLATSGYFVLPQPNDILPIETIQFEPPNYILEGDYRNNTLLGGEPTYFEELQDVSSASTSLGGAAKRKRHSCSSSNHSNDDNDNDDDDIAYSNNKNNIIQRNNSKHAHQPFAAANAINSKHSKKLSSLVDEYEVVYAKHPLGSDKTNSAGFNIVTCDPRSINHILAKRQKEKNAIDLNRLVKEKQVKNFDIKSESMIRQEKLTGKSGQIDFQPATEVETPLEFSEKEQTLEQDQQEKQFEKQQQQNNSQDISEETMKQQSHAKGKPVIRFLSEEIEDIEQKQTLEVDEEVEYKNQSNRSIAFIQQEQYKQQQQQQQQPISSDQKSAPLIYFQKKKLTQSSAIVVTATQQKEAKIQQYQGTSKKQSGSRQTTIDEVPSLMFSSEFECGNLAYAIRMSSRSYNLILQNDINTRGHTQWFYFRVCGSSSSLKGKITFNIVNFIKPRSLFCQGMKVMVHNRRLRETSGLGWHRGCEGISYTMNEFRRETCFTTTTTTATLPGQAGLHGGSGSSSNYYSLTFTYDFGSAPPPPPTMAAMSRKERVDGNENIDGKSDEVEDNYEVYFAYNYPYTYSDLQSYLGEIEADPLRSKHMQRRLLCRTLAQNRVDVLTITEGVNKLNKEKNKDVMNGGGSSQQGSGGKSGAGKKEKKTIILSARVHPGETVSSFMMKGCIDFLLSDTSDALFLRTHFVFKVIPMLNPDGVVHGNYRCSLAGKDLNRQWKNPDKELFVEIYSLKKLVVSASNRLALFCDLHGHSMKKNIFVYGCHDAAQPSACREIPLILSKIYEPFSFRDCNFAVKPDKQGTARVALWKSLRIPNIFTIESSFCGPSYHSFHFSLAQIEAMGTALCQALVIYYGRAYSSFLKVHKTTMNFEDATDNNGETKEEEGEVDALNGKNNNNNNVQQLLGMIKKQVTLADVQAELKNKPNLLATGLDDTDGSDDSISDEEDKTVLGAAAANKKDLLAARAGKSPGDVQNLQQQQQISPLQTQTTILVTPAKKKLASIRFSGESLEKKNQSDSLQTIVFPTNPASISSTKLLSVEGNSSIGGSSPLGRKQTMKTLPLRLGLKHSYLNFPDSKTGRSNLAVSSEPIPRYIVNIQYKQSNSHGEDLADPLRELKHSQQQEPLQSMYSTPRYSNESPIRKHIVIKHAKHHRQQQQQQQHASQQQLLIHERDRSEEIINNSNSNGSIGQLGCDVRKIFPAINLQQQQLSFTSESRSNISMSSSTKITSLFPRVIIKQESCHSSSSSSCNNSACNSVLMKPFAESKGDGGYLYSPITEVSNRKKRIGGSSGSCAGSNASTPNVSIAAVNNASLRDLAHSAEVGLLNLTSTEERSHRRKRKSSGILQSAALAAAATSPQGQMGGITTSAATTSMGTTLTENPVYSSKKSFGVLRKNWSLGEEENPISGMKQIDIGGHYSIRVPIISNGCSANQSSSLKRAQVQSIQLASLLKDEKALQPVQKSLSTHNALEFDGIKICLPPKRMFLGS